MQDFFVQQEFLMFLVEWVLGMIVLLGMPMKKGLESEYKKLSSELLTQIRLALLYSVNEW